MDNAEFINLLANENMTQKIKQVRQKEYDLMVLTNQQKDQEEKAKKESKKRKQKKKAKNKIRVI